MLVFIDESGAFKVPTPPRNLVCGVAALVVPEAFAATLFRRFRKTIRPWRDEGRREVKGSSLDEHQSAQVLAVLRRFDVLVFANCIDMGLHTEARIEEHKLGQAKALTRTLTERHSPQLRDEVGEFARRLASLPNQLYVQSLLLTEVVDRVLRMATLYYAQRIPSTLRQFVWRVDAKGKAPTNHERLWAEIVKPLLQTSALERPQLTLTGADYSAFARFMGVEPEPPPHLRGALRGRDASPFHYIDIGAVLRDLRFCDSERYTGIQVADIVGATMTRACNGKLGKAGWKDLGRVMLQNENSKSALRFHTLDETRAGVHPVPYTHVVTSYERACKRMVTRSTRSRVDMRTLPPPSRPLAR